MATFYGIVTDIGDAAIANALFEGVKVNITQMAVGDGGGAYYAPTADMIALKREVLRVPAVVTLDAEDPKVITVTAALPASVGGFTVREMGAYDDRGRFVAVANTPDMQKIADGSGALQDFVLVMQVRVSNTAVINVTADPSVILATKNDIAALRVYIDGQVAALEASKGQPNGLATLDANGDAAQNPASAGKPNGLATLNGSGKAVQNPASMGLANGLATLDANRYLAQEAPVWWRPKLLFSRPAAVLTEALATSVFGDASFAGRYYVAVSPGLSGLTGDYFPEVAPYPSDADIAAYASGGTPAAGWSGGLVYVAFMKQPSAGFYAAVKLHKARTGVG